ncbi:hypothetical protein D0U04_13670 [Bacillus clarus]|uniref:Uncharacterized protein n=1 Tax=Bacillus clarus TaxID=2338372 RepID=A0A090Z0N1_9BACI|nr:hypothetical protein [Bacillus clarus]KFN04177.1 hypothetical protein DJ93_387 [Bacillus clarus]RFT66492.1 hypothetical protein D0U04_13670 [Bacillus clarus]
MAKLNNVKVVNENTVEYDGFVYGLVTGDAQLNDLVKAADYELDVTEGAFYLITGIDSDSDIEFYDDANDGNLFFKGHHPVFRKSHAITNDKLADAEGVVTITLPDGTKLEGTPSDLASVTRSMKALQAEQSAMVEMPEEAVEVEDASEPVAERLQVGNYAKVIKEGTHSCKVGDIVKIFHDDKDDQPFECEDLQSGELLYPWFFEYELVRATEAEVQAVAEPKEEPLKVGDYARLISTNFNTNAGLNEIVIINVVDKTLIPYGIKNLNGEEIGWAPKDHLVKATDAEVLEAKQTLLKEGGFARVISNDNTTSYCGAHDYEAGTVIKLTWYDANDNTFKTTYLNGDKPDAPWVHRNDLEPLTAEEAEHIEREAEEEKKAKAERTKWTAIGREVGEIKKGDIVRTTTVDGSVNPIGTIGYARRNGTVESCSTVALNGDTGNWSSVELIVPVEQLFDTVG